MTHSLDDHLAAYQDDFAYAFDNDIILNWYPRQLIAQTPASASVLELGIGHGLTCHRFAEYFDTYEVIDASQAVLDQFRRNYPGSKARTHKVYFEDFAPGRTYDLIVMGFVLEHVEDPGAILRRYKAFLAEGGTLAIAVPNAQSLHRRFGNAAGLLPDMMALGDGDRMLGHLRLFTVDTLSALLDGAGYEVSAKEGIFLKPFTTAQLKSLALPATTLDAMCEVGRDYPELCAGLLFKARAR